MQNRSLVGSPPRIIERILRDDEATRDFLLALLLLGNYKGSNTSYIK